MKAKIPDSRNHNQFASKTHNPDNHDNESKAILPKSNHHGYSNDTDKINIDSSSSI